MRDDGTGKYSGAFQQQDSQWGRWGMEETGTQATWIPRQGSWLRLIAGWACIGLGVLGLILPIIPGIPLLIFGLFMLSTRYHWAHKTMVWVKRKFPKRQPSR